MTNTAIKNTTDNLDTVIRDVVSSTSKLRGLQTRMAYVMYQSEASFSFDECKRLLLLAGKDKTAAHNKALCEMSDTYNTMNVDRNTIGAVKNKTDKQKLTLSSIDADMKASRVMFERSLKMVFFFRHPDASITNVSKLKAKPTVLRVTMPDHEVEVEDGEALPITSKDMTGQQMETAGNALLNKIRTPSKAAKPASDKGNGIATVAATLSGMVSAAKGAAFTNEAGEAVESLLDQLFLAHFAEKGRIDMEGVKAYVADLQAQLESKDDIDQELAKPAKKAATK